MVVGSRSDDFWRTLHNILCPVAVLWLTLSIFECQEMKLVAQVGPFDIHLALFWKSLGPVATAFGVRGTTFCALWSSSGLLGRGPAVLHYPVPDKVPSSGRQGAKNVGFESPKSVNIICFPTSNSVLLKN